MTAPKVFLHVDRIVLRGVPREQRDQVLRGLREELARSLGNRDYLEALTDRRIATVRVAGLPSAGQGSGSALGRQSARLVAKGIRG